MTVMRKGGLAGLLLLAAFGAFGAFGACGIGDRVQLKDGGSGTLVEIGSTSPHMGWYRIALPWSADGEWFDPATWETRNVDTGEVCRVGATPRPAAAAPASTAPSTTPRESASAPANEDCPFTEPTATVTRGARASAELFQRMIYERAAARINPGSITAPKRVGLSFVKFRAGTPYENTLTSTRFGDKRLHTGAPAGATLYPIETVELQCDLHGSEVRRTLSAVSRTCFVNRDGDWSCPGGQTKTLQSRLIPVRG